MPQPVTTVSNFGFAGVEDATEGRELTYIGAISEALRDEMRRDPRVLMLGEDIAGEFGGAFKVTRGFEVEFGSRRVMNTPIADLGAVPWVIRAPSDGGLRSGPFHSQNPEAWFVHTPGLKVVAPATPADAKGLLIAAIRDDNPVIYFESKALYRTLKGHVPAGDYVVPIGAANLVRRGDALSIITYGTQVREAPAAERLAAEQIECDVLDLRTLKPLDIDAILSSVRRTSRALIVHSANQLAGVGAEVAAVIAAQAFAWLDAPVTRLGGLDTPVPLSPPLEDVYRPNARKIVEAALAGLSTPLCRAL
jgi:2-oxoisovalerate dehydrogenase E1 component beta subunit